MSTLPVEGKRYSSFDGFMREYVIPLREARPAARLDGETTGGNRTVAGSFQHDGRWWEVHADTHFEPLRIAWDEMGRTGKDPFRREPTKHGQCLVLRDDLRASYRSRFKHHYIYDAGAA